MEAWQKSGYLLGSQRSRLLDGAAKHAAGSAHIGDSLIPTKPPRWMRESLLTSINVRRIPSFAKKIAVTTLDKGRTE